MIGVFTLWKYSRRWDGEYLLIDHNYDKESEEDTFMFYSLMGNIPTGHYPYYKFVSLEWWHPGGHIFKTFISI